MFVAQEPALLRQRGSQKRDRLRRSISRDQQRREAGDGRRQLHMLLRAALFAHSQGLAQQRLRPIKATLKLPQFAESVPAPSQVRVVGLESPLPEIDGGAER